jgi:hypothetical protein
LQWWPLFEERGDDAAHDERSSRLKQLSAHGELDVVVEGMGVACGMRDLDAPRFLASDAGSHNADSTEGRG